MINQQNKLIEDGLAEKNRMKEHLFSLIQTNEMLFRELEKSCTEDRKVQKMLSGKLDKLVVANEKINEK